MWNTFKRFFYKLLFPNEQRRQAEFISSLFGDLLGRDPTNIETDYWLSRLSECCSPTKIYFEIIDTDEYRQRKKIINIDEQKKKDFINSLHNDLLERNPDPEIFDAWIERLTRFSSPVDIYFEFIGESKKLPNRKPISDEKKVEFVSSLYSDLLQREVQEDDLNYWVSRFEYLSPVDIYLYFTNIEEFKQLHAVKLFAPPGHFYSPIVDPDELIDCADSIFDKDRELPGVELNGRAQIEYFGKLRKHQERIPWGEEKQPGLRYFYNNPAFSCLDATILAYMIMEHRPGTIIEIGSGYSSAATLDIVERELGGATKCCFIEPYPQLLESLCKPEDFSRIQIFPKVVQRVALEVYDQLECGDILFIDSTHIVKTGSDVVHLVQNVLPRIKPGVLIHFHDIFYPFEYPVGWVLGENRSWNESHYLSAFLTNNSEYEILFFNDFFYRKHRSLLKTVVPNCRQDSGASLWIRKNAEVVSSKPG